MWTIRYSLCCFNLFRHESLEVYLDQENMRRHLNECLENQKFRNVPFSVNTNWKKKKVTKTREHIYCICRGLYDGEMVQGVVCKIWLHHRCLDVRTLKRIEQDPNFCFKCSNC